MVFNSSGSPIQPKSYNLGVESPLASFDSSPRIIPRNFSLNAPMIDRVHKAKPGCSACGKKVS